VDEPRRLLELVADRDHAADRLFIGRDDLEAIESVEAVVSLVE
jgi:hypothetical protein